MLYKKYIDIVFILAGGMIALYANAEKEQNIILLIIGISILLIGIYKLSSKIPSKTDEENDSNKFTDTF